MPAAIDVTGERYGKLVAIRYTKSKRYPCGAIRRLWLFECDCGNSCEKSLFDVRRADTKSCGCARSDSRSSHNKLAKGESSTRQYINRLRLRAKAKGVPYSLTREQIERLISQDCHYCGVEPRQKFKTHKLSNGEITYNGLDRKNVEEGYVLGNVVTCCGRCNRAKSDTPYEEFINWIGRVYERMF